MSSSGQRRSEGGPEKWPKGWRAFLVRKDWRNRVTSSQGREGVGGPHHSLPVHKGHLRRGQNLTPHMELHGEDAIGTSCTRKAFIDTDLLQWEEQPVTGKQPPDIMVESPSHKFSRCDWTRSHLIWTPFPMEGWTRWSFKVLSNLCCCVILWFYDYNSRWEVAIIFDTCSVKNWLFLEQPLCWLAKNITLGVGEDAIEIIYIQCITISTC